MLPVKAAFIIVSFITVYLINKLQLSSDIEIVVNSSSVMCLIDSLTKKLFSKLKESIVSKSL
jgi:hypothetical protein